MLRCRSTSANSIPALALLALLALPGLVGCGNNASTSPVIYSGGQPGTPCATTAQVACLASATGPILVQCSGGTWQQVGACQGAEVCVETLGTAACKDFSNPDGATGDGAAGGTMDSAGGAASDVEGGNGGGTSDSAQTDSVTPRDPADAVADVPTICGNGSCEVGENNLECPQDCSSPKCGNGACEAGETPTSCVKDCGNNCPGGTSCPCVSDFDCKIGVCHTSGSNKKTCPQECVEACPTDWTCTEVQNANGDFVNVCVSKSGAVCGDGKCSTKESVDTCAKDCKASAICGDGTCSGQESNANCPQDCPPPAVCGDGLCNGGETSATCAKDCPPAAVCGDGVCNGSESNATCAKDCPSGTVCGNSLCEAPENFQSCPTDCVTAAAGCKGRCGLSSKTADGSMCYCDLQCLQSNDCCPDYTTYCGSGGTCTPNCKGKTCGGDGCGGSCGKCATGQVCDTAVGTCKANTLCGNGICDPAENPTNCSKDCKSLHPCDEPGVCGGPAQNFACYCDASCKQNKDCCTLFGGKASTCTGALCAACK